MMANTSENPEQEPASKPAASIAWLDWGQEAFERAAREDKPLLLDVFGLWCHWCHVMDETTYEHPDVISLINERYVPVRVDTDRHPEVNDRYNQGGWPSTVILDPTGHVLFGATYVPPEQMRVVLRQVSEAFRLRRAEIAQKAREQDLEASRQRVQIGLVDPRAVDTVMRAIRRSFDAEYGGFGVAPKFPQPAVLDFVLARAVVTDDAQLRELVHKSLIGMLPLFDDVDGGFYRYSVTRDWTVPHYEKMLEGNAGLLATYADAYRVFGDEQFRKVAAETARFLLGTLRDPERGAFWASQDADVFSHDPTRETVPGERYFALPASARRAIGEPYVDCTIIAAYNAMAVRGLVRAHLALGDGGYLGAGRRAADFVLQHMRTEDGAFRRYLDGNNGALGPAGLLTDQAWMLVALTELAEATGQQGYLHAAQETAQYLEAHLAAPEGGFYDVPQDEEALGLVRLRDVPLGGNATAAKGLLRLAELTGDGRYATLARGALRVGAAMYERYGIMAAEYAQAVWWATKERDPAAGNSR